MLRKGDVRSLHWADKTMSVLRANRLEACEKYLAGLPSLCLFDAECNDQNVDLLFSGSYYSSELSAALYTADALRELVLRNFAPELALLSADEHTLLIKMVLFGGRVPLTDWNDMEPANSLVRRLWCKAEKENNTITLVMPHQLCTAALLLLASQEHKQIRDQIDKVDETVENTLYLNGLLQEDVILSHIEQLLHTSCAAGKGELFRRFLHAGYDCMADRSGHMFLIHSGLAEPEKILYKISCMPFSAKYNTISPPDIFQSLDELEDPVYERMLSLLTDALRPEIIPEDAVEDLIILAKQDVPLHDMREVLSSFLICLPTPDMLFSLHELHDRIPRWFSMNMSKVQ